MNLFILFRVVAQGEGLGGVTKDPFGVGAKSFKSENVLSPVYHIYVYTHTNENCPGLSMEITLPNRI